jgi:hypothetical protein
MSEPWAADWEQIVGCDLVPYLIPAGPSQWARRPISVTSVPDGAHVALSDGVGHVGPGGLLVVPAAAWRWQGWPRRSLYSPLSVVGIGEHGVGLWVRTLPTPDVRVRMPFSDIAGVEHHSDGPWWVIGVTGMAGRLLVRYREDGQTGADQWIRCLRLRAAPTPAPVPPAPFGGRGLCSGRDPKSCLLDPRGDVIWAGWRSRANGAACQLVVTARELIIARSRPGRGRLGRRITRTLYVPRQALQGAAARAGCLRLRSAGTDVDVGLWSDRAADAASSWLNQVLGDRDCSGAGSWQGQPGGA